MTITLNDATTAAREGILQWEDRPQAHTHRVLVAVRWPVGGIRTHLVYNYPHVARRGYRFTVVGPADETLHTLRRSLSGLDGLEFVGVPVNGKRCGLWREVRRQLRTGRYDLVHAHGLTAAVHTSLANTLLHYPHVATLHDVFRPCHFAGIVGPFKRRTLAYLLGQVHALIPVSEDVRLNLLEYLPSLQRRKSSIVPIPNGIDFDAKPCVQSHAQLGMRKRLGLAGDVRLIGFLGRFMEQKGFLPLLHALRQLADSSTSEPFHLVAVGSGDYRKEYTATLRNLGLADLVSVLDFMPDVRPVFAELDLLVIPSLWEASSLLAMEALAAGVPVLGTDCIGLREVLQGTPARTVRTGDATALAAGLRAALDSPWTQEARAFAVQARTRFDNTPSAEKLADVFDELIRQRQRS